jgi:putative methyltransferase
LESFRNSINSGSNDTQSSTYSAEGETVNFNRRHPRWVRVNTLRTTLGEQLSTTFADYTRCDNLSDVVTGSGKEKLFFIDQNIPNLLAFPPQCDLFKSKAYQMGMIIFQDKASCFPAYLLDVQETDDDVIDACAAPGNKTTHLAATGSTHKIIAFERNKQRTETLKKMVTLAGAENIVTIRGTTDFLSTKPHDPSFSNVTAILLDPSCSGSGIVGRDDEPQLILPSKQAIQENDGAKSRKRKRNQPVSATEPIQNLEVVENEKEHEEKALAERLALLSGFQLKIIDHAMRFPATKKIVYSTCSIHAEENEEVVINALASDAAREFGWGILLRPMQVKGMREWDIRGDNDACHKAIQKHTPCFAKPMDVSLDIPLSTDLLEGVASGIADACIRCQRGTSAGTMGFFVAGFVRNVDESEDYNENYLAMILQNKLSNGESKETNEKEEHPMVDFEEEEEWAGFSDDHLETGENDATVAKDSRVEHKSPLPKLVPKGKKMSRKREKLKEVEKAGSWCK